MPFRFKKKESVAKAVRRICREISGDALEPLKNAADLGAVHDVRKEIKKLRSLLRLVRRDIGKDAYGKYNHTLRDAAGRLTGMRDAQVTLGTFESVAKEFDGQPAARPFLKIRIALQGHCQAEEKKLGRSLPPVKHLLRESQQQFEHLKMKSNGWKVIRAGLKKVYGRGREAFETAEREPSPENFHEWRKHVKDLHHHLSLLERTCPGKLEVRVKDLEKLGSLLGDEHDLVMLREFVAGKLDHEQDLRQFENAIASRQEKLRSKALKLGARFYPKKPNRFCRQIGGYWKDWRRG